MIIRYALGLVHFALAMFILVAGLYGFRFIFWSELLLQLALKIWLLGFGLLLLSGLGFVIKRFGSELQEYFAHSARLKRRLAFIRARENQLNRLYTHRINYLDYFHELKRRCLLKSNHRKHINELVDSIQRDLRAIRTSLPATAYQEFSQRLKVAQRQQDLANLINLQQQLHQHLAQRHV